MKFFAALAILSLVALAVLGDFLWRRWIAKVSAARQKTFSQHEREAFRDRD